MTTTRIVLRDLDRFINQEIVRLAVNLAAEEKRVAPVDTGFFRAGWEASAGGFNPLTLDQDQATVASQESASSNSLARIVSFKFRADGNIYLFNRASYTETLNSRGSTVSAISAAPMFIEAAADRVVARENKRRATRARVRRR